MIRSSLRAEQNKERFSGRAWYVSASGSDSNSGAIPSKPFLTIAKAIATASNGDLIVISCGVYAENVTVNKNCLTLRGENGAIILGSVTLSSDSAVLEDLTISPTAAEGVVISSDFNVVSGVRVIGTPTTSVNVSGINNVLRDTITVGYSVAGFDLSGSQNSVFDSLAGNPVGAARGFYVSNAAVVGCQIRDCVSVGNSISGYEIATGSTGCIIRDCSSGGGDGGRVDGGVNTTWPGYTYEDEISKVITFNNDTTHNFFKLTGSVRLSDLHGEVVTTIPNTTSLIHIEVYSANGSVDITDAPGVDIDSAVAGALLVRNQDSTNVLALANPDTTPAVAEVSGPGASNPPTGTSIDIVADDSADTYIRVVASAPLASGAIDWHGKWSPLGVGFLEAV